MIRMTRHWTLQSNFDMYDGVDCFSFSLTPVVKETEKKGSKENEQTGQKKR